MSDLSSKKKLLSYIRSSNKAIEIGDTFLFEEYSKLIIPLFKKQTTSIIKKYNHAVLKLPRL